MSSESAGAAGGPRDSDVERRADVSPAIPGFLIGQGEDSAGQSPRIVDLVFDVVQVEMPIEDRRHSRKIWNHVDELRVDPGVAACLSRNGVRIGVAAPAAWPAIRAILKVGEASVRRDQLAPQPGLPLLVQVGTVEGAESIFSYGADGRLVGKTIPAGDKVVVIDYVHHPELGGFVELGLGLEIRHDRGVMTWERRGGVIREVPSYDVYTFPAVQAPLTVTREEVVVIGLGEDASNDYLLGSRFLLSRRAEGRYETLLLITPRAIEG